MDRTGHYRQMTDHAQLVAVRVPKVGAVMVRVILGRSPGAPSSMPPCAKATCQAASTWANGWPHPAPASGHYLADAPRHQMAGQSTIMADRRQPVASRPRPLALAKSPGMAQHGHQRIIKRQRAIEITDPKNTCENTAQLGLLLRGAQPTHRHIRQPHALLRRLCGDKPQQGIHWRGIDRGVDSHFRRRSARQQGAPQAPGNPQRWHASATNRW